jgi:DNA-binding protein HU-beta
MAKVTKEDLVEVLAKKGCSKKDASDYLNTVLDEIGDSLSKGKDVVLTGFGTFSVSKRKARTGRNPQTGATIKIPAKKVPRFKAGKGLKDTVK